MPFTFAHPAAILPLRLLKKNWFSLTGLVIGSMVPDFEYFIRMRDDSFYSHKLSGVLWFDLPLGLMLTFLYHGIVRNALLLNLPALLQIRFAIWVHFNWFQYFKKHFLFILSSLAIGILSHLLWDRLTHETASFFQNLPDVREHLYTQKRKIASYYVLWYGNSLLGVLIVLFFVWKSPVQIGVPMNRKILSYWLGVSCFTFSFFLIRILCCEALFLADRIVSVISCFLASLLMMGSIESVFVLNGKFKSQSHM
jgi:Domain of unknown function (DUF4184)